METKIGIGSCGNKKYGIKTIALFSDGGKRTELYKSTAKFEVELITELVDTLTDMFRLHFQVFVVVKTDFHLILRS